MDVRDFDKILKKPDRSKSVSTNPDDLKLINDLKSLLGSISDLKSRLDQRSVRFNHNYSLNRNSTSLSREMLFYKERIDESSIGHKLIRLEQELEFRMENFSKFHSLTPREREVLLYVGRGLTNKDISKVLFISRSTVEQHRKNINRKLEINSVARIMKFCYAFDLI